LGGSATSTVRNWLLNLFHVAVIINPVGTDHPHPENVIPGGETSSTTSVMNYWQEIVVEKSTRILPGMGVQFIF
jgi:hypothetical protein